MRAYTIAFKHPVRTGPTTPDRKERLRLDDRGFAGGSIDVQVKERVVRIWNPAKDSVTGEPVETFVPFDNLLEWEVLSEKQEAKYYPERNK